MQLLGPHHCLLLTPSILPQQSGVLPQQSGSESCPNSQDPNLLPDRIRRQYSQHYNHPLNLPPNHPFYGMMQLHGFHHCLLLLPILPQQSGSSSTHRIGLSGALLLFSYNDHKRSLSLLFPFSLADGGEGPTGLQTPWALCRHKGEASLVTAPFLP